MKCSKCLLGELGTVSRGFERYLEVSWAFQGVQGVPVVNIKVLGAFHGISEGSRWSHGYFRAFKGFLTCSMWFYGSSSEVSGDSRAILGGLWGVSRGFWGVREI